MLLFVYFVICPLFSSSSFQFCMILVWTLIQLWNCLIVPIDLGSVFQEAGAFNGDLSKWDTSKATAFGSSTFATTTSSKYTMQKLFFFPFVWLFLPVFTHTLTRLNASFCLFCNLSSLFFFLFSILYDSCLNTHPIVELSRLCPLILDQCLMVL